MGKVNYEQLVSELIKPIVSRPDEVKVTTVIEKNGTIYLKAIVHQDDLGRVIGKKGRVANAIRTIAYVAATREKVQLEIDFVSNEEEDA